MDSRRVLVGTRHPMCWDQRTSQIQILLLAILKKKKVRFYNLGFTCQRRIHMVRHKGNWVHIFNPIQNIGRTMQAKSLGHGGPAGR